MRFTSGTKLMRRLQKTQTLSRGACTFDVLWLSPNLFISPKDVFLPGGRGTSDYKVRLTLRSFERSGKDDVIIFLHSLSSFQNEDEQEHLRSPLLLHLLRYLISKLPSDGVRSVTFEWLNRRGLDPSFLVDYLSIIPSTETRYIVTSSRHQRPHQILLPDVVQISVTQVLTVAQFEAIVPHLTNHNARVIFNGFWDTEIEGFIPEQTALLNRMFNAALLDCATLRHTEVPEYFLCNAFHTWDETDVPFTVNHFCFFSTALPLTHAFSNCASQTYSRNLVVIISSIR
jgi:hypothetical protein